MAAADTYNTIVLSPEPRGRFIEGIMATGKTPKPGTVMQLEETVEPIGGKFSYEPYDPAADGDNPIGPIIVLIEDTVQGKSHADAYVADTQCFLYIPLPGDELLMILQDVAGTGDDHTIGEILMVDKGTGKLIVTTGVESEPFVCMETITDPTADTLAHVMFAGN